MFWTLTVTRLGTWWFSFIFRLWPLNFVDGENISTPPKCLCVNSPTRQQLHLRFTMINTVAGFRLFADCSLKRAQSLPARMQQMQPGHKIAVYHCALLKVIRQNNIYRNIIHVLDGSNSVRVSRTFVWTVNCRLNDAGDYSILTPGFFFSHELKTRCQIGSGNDFPHCHV